MTFEEVTKNDSSQKFPLSFYPKEFAVPSPLIPVSMTA
jgi:hypothetical protein